MRIILATGIYPPEIGGPATYVWRLAEELSKMGNEVRVVTYGSDIGLRTSDFGPWQVTVVAKSGGPLFRWWRYARALRNVAADTDIVEAFSSVSVGVPLMLARLKKPKKILRLGGDFFWERYTDHGGKKGLKEWYAGKPRSRFFMQKILRLFDHIIFSTRFEEALYEKVYALPPHSVIENAVPPGSPMLHEKHDPFRLLFVGRFVGFKNLPSLFLSLMSLPDCRLTLVGAGPMEGQLKALARQHFATDRVRFLPPVFGEGKQRIFAEHDLLVLPSLTELSPNVALEARVSGLPVLLTRGTGLSDVLIQGMVVADLSTPGHIVDAIRRVQAEYNSVAQAAASAPPSRGWADVFREHLSLFERP